MNTRQVQIGSLTVSCIWMTLALVGMDHFPVYAQEETGEESYHYDPGGKRDPFLSPFYHQPEQAMLEEAKTPLQRFDLGQLKLVGIVLEEKEPKALIEDSGGLGYIVTKGTPIGSKGGIIKAIEPKRVVVEEYETDFYGKRQAQERELLLFVGGSAPEGEAKKTR
jgi:type IV pilus assembly protein PilP